MKEQIILWKEYKEDQKARNKAMLEDPERENIWKGASYLTYSLATLYEDILKNKYGIEEQTYGNFLNWLANDKPLFKGVKHEVII